MTEFSRKRLVGKLYSYADRLSTITIDDSSNNAQKWAAFDMILDILEDIEHDCAYAKRRMIMIPLRQSE